MAETILGARFRQQVQFEIYVVQPGVRKDGREQVISHLLAAANFYISQGGVDVFGIIGS